MGRILASLLAASLTAASAPASAASSGPTPGSGWAVDWADQHCSLIRQSGSDVFALRTVPGSGVWEVRLIKRPWPRGALRDARRVALSLLPAGEILPGRPYVRSIAGEDSLVVHQIPRSLLGRFAAAQGIRAERNGETVLDIPFAGAAEAIAAVRQCEDRALREWGIDPVAFAALRAPPTGLPAAVVNDGDYPPGAVRARQSGMVVVRLMIDARGRVSDCTPVVSSWHANLDSRSCVIFRERLRMTPAVGADGNPTAAPLVTPLNWLLPG
jgi:TonB family protein